MSRRGKSDYVKNTKEIVALVAWVEDEKENLTDAEILSYYNKFVPPDPKTKFICEVSA